MADELLPPKFVEPRQPITLNMVEREENTFALFENELDSLATSGNSLSFTFFGVCFGAFVAFGIVLDSGGIDQAKHGMYVMLAFASGIMSTFFFLSGMDQRIKAKAKLKKLKQGRRISGSNPNE